MLRLHPIDSLSRKAPILAGLLDDLLHPTRGRKPVDDDPSRPFTPPPSQPSKEERDDDDDGPSFPMDPAVA